MRNQETIEHLYNTYLKACARKKEEYEAGYDPYFYGLYLGSAMALGFTLEKTIPEINRDLKRAEKRFKN
jgi:hypothetical protein